MGRVQLWGNNGMGMAAPPPSSSSTPSSVTRRTPPSTSSGTTGVSTSGAASSEVHNGNGTETAPAPAPATTTREDQEDVPPSLSSSRRSEQDSVIEIAERAAKQEEEAAAVITTRVEGGKVSADDEKLSAQKEKGSDDDKKKDQHRVLSSAEMMKNERYQQDTLPSPFSHCTVQPLPSPAPPKPPSQPGAFAVRRSVNANHANNPAGGEHYSDLHFGVSRDFVEEEEQQQPVMDQDDATEPMWTSAAPPPGADSRDGSIRRSEVTNTTRTSSPTTTTTNENDTPMDRREGLVEARKVSDSMIFSIEDLDVAEPVLMEKDAINKRTSIRKSASGEPQQQQQDRFALGGGESSKGLVITKGRVCVLGLMFFLIISVGINIALFLGNNGNDNSSSKEEGNEVQQPSHPYDNNNNHTTTVPPTAAPTQDQLLALLPSSTQSIILQDFSTNSTAQTKAYQWLLGDPNRGNYSDERILQRYAMATFWYSTNGPNWKHQGGQLVTMARPKPGKPPGVGPVTLVNISREQWLDYESHECLWFGSNTDGTFCEVDNRTVQTLSLLQNDVTGSLPEELGLLTSLTSLLLHGNRVGGTLITQLGKLTDLTRLYLMSNQFTGTVPSEIALLSKLERLGLIDNQLEGSFPSQLWSMPNLLHFKIGRNNFLPNMTVPTKVSTQLPKLESIIMDWNHLGSGNALPALSQCTNLKELAVAETQITGTIPSQIGTLSNLNKLILFGNQLTSSLPSQVGLASKLKELVLNDNSGLVGSLPKELGLLNESLARFDIRNTGLTGTIPAPLCETPKLNFDCSPELCGCTCPC